MINPSQITSCVRPSARRFRSGLTLVEMLVSVALTLIVVFALVRVFESLGAGVTEGRATIEMSGNLRSAAQLLRSDLAGLTVTALPPRAPGQGEGYFEYADGPGTDYQYMTATGLVSWISQQPANADTNADGYIDNPLVETSLGDIDDVIAFTSRNMHERLRGWFPIRESSALSAL